MYSIVIQLDVDIYSFRKYVLADGLNMKCERKDGVQGDSWVLMKRMGRMKLPLTEMKKTMDGRGLRMGANQFYD